MSYGLEMSNSFAAAPDTGGNTLYTYVFVFSNIATCQRIARQRLDKHPAIRARNNMTNVYSPLLGKSQGANELAR
jgi:hypothetical protein